jgi:PAS domain S-box-containing protein
MSGDINAYSSDGSPCVFASGETNKLGEITQINMGVCRTFGYSKTELIGRKITVIMPELYGKYHDHILQNAVNNSEEYIQVLFFHL